MRACLFVVAGLVLVSPGASFAEPEPEPDAAGGFGFGSYGRVSIGTDLRGGTPEKVEVVGHGARIVEPSYLELDLYYDGPEKNGIGWRTVATVAFADDLFHYSGEFDATVAIRNLYAEAVIRDQVGVWVGSRMFRGDDIYLLDFWPLDDLNTVGGGAWWRSGPWQVRGAVGANRLRDAFQYQQIEVPHPEFGAATIEQLDRQRFVASVAPTYSGPWYKAKLYFDMHALADGKLRREDETIESLPDDFGWTAGAQLGAWGFGHGTSHANLFVKLAQGLAAFDELQVPEGLGTDKRTYPGAKEFLLGASASYQLPLGGVLLGAYTRRFVDADPTVEDRDDGWEYIADIRPYVNVLDVLQIAMDISYQQRFPRGVSPTLLESTSPSVFQIAPMLVFSPSGPDAYARPHLRLVYRAARLDEGARDLYPLADPRRAHRWAHFLGLQAEWWFNSTTYE